MADINDLYDALRAADAAGNKDDVQKLIGAINAYQSGISTEEKKAAKEARFSPLENVLALGQGVVGGVKSLTDVFGAGNVASESLSDLSQFIGKGYSPERIAEMQRRAEIQKEAEKTGNLSEEVKAYLGQYTEAPIQSTFQALGSVVPYLASGAIGGLMKLGTSTVRAVNATIGAAQGAGTIKGSIYDNIKDELVKSGMSEAKAKEKAHKAQEYLGPNIGQIITGAGLGALGARYGVEDVLTPGALAKMDARLAARVGKGILAEGPVEGIQGGQEQLAVNRALQDEGFARDAMQGVFGAAIRDAVIGATLGGAVGIAGPKATAGAAPEVETLPPTTPITQTNAPVSAPVTEAGLAPVAPTIPEVPASFESPTGIPTTPSESQVAQPSGAVTATQEVTPGVVASTQTPEAAASIEPIRGYYATNQPIQGVQDLGQHPGLGHEFAIQRPETPEAQVLESDLHFQRTLDIPNVRNMNPLELAHNISQVESAAREGVDIEVGTQAAMQQAARQAFENLPEELRPYITSQQNQPVDTNTPQYQEAQQTIARAANEAGNSYVRQQLQDLGYDSIRYQTEVNGQPSNGFIALQQGRVTPVGERPVGAPTTPVTAPVTSTAAAPEVTEGTPSAPPRGSAYYNEGYAVDKTKEQIYSEIKGFTTAHQIAEWLIQNAPNDFARELATKIRDRYQEFTKLGIPMKLEILNGSKRPKDSWMGQAAFDYRNPKAGYTLRLRGVDSKGKADTGSGLDYNTMLHESAHNATQVQITISELMQKYRNITPPQYIKDLQDLLSKVRREANKARKNGTAPPVINRMKGNGPYLSNEHELLAYGLTNENFQKYLGTIKLGKETAWNKLIDIIRRSLGLDQKYESALDRLMTITESILEPKADKLIRSYRDAESIFGLQGTFKGERPETVDIGPLSKQNQVANRLVQSTQPASYGQRIRSSAINAFNSIQNDDYRTSNRVAWIDKNSGLARTLGSQPTFDLNGQLRADMLLRTQDQMINLISNGLQTGTPTINSDGTIIIDRSENNLARTQVIADTLDGKMTFDGQSLSGRMGVATVARILRGKDIMAEDVALREKGRRQLAYAKQLMQDVKDARDAGRPIAEIRGLLQSIRMLRQDGYRNAKMRRELQVTPKDIKWAEEQVKNIPEVKEILGVWKNVNDSLVTLWENAGLLTKEQADNYRAKDNYVPLFKSRDDLEGRDGTYAGNGGAKSVKGIKKLTGSQATRNIWENIDKHYAAMVAAAYQNQTRKVATEQLVALEAAEIVSHDNPDVNLRYRDPTNEFANAQGIVSAIVQNPNDLAAFQMMHYELGPILKAFAATTKVLRAGALVNPMYWIKQLIRDPIHANLVANSGIVTPFHSGKEFVNILANRSEEAKILASRGVIGQIDSTIDIHDFLKQAGQEKQKTGALDKALRKVMQMHEASDAATRVAIYKKEYAQAIKDGMSKEMATNYAVHKARESINFAVKGNSPTLNALRHMVPFLSAAITSLDTVYRAAFGVNMSPEEKAQAQKLFVSRALMLSVMSVAYAMAYQDNDDYKRQSDRVKDDNWLIPNPFGTGHTFIKIPVPFEVGFLFKTIPEASVRYMAGTSTGKEVLASYALGLAHNLPGGSIPPISLLPQAIKPIIETQANYSFYTGRPIESMSDQNKPIEARGERASELAKILSSYGLKKLNLSPAKIDYLIQGYMAELGTFSTGMASSAIQAAEGKNPVAKNLEETPFMKSFMTNPNASKAIADFYDLDHNAAQTVKYFNDLKKTGNVQEAKKFLEDEDHKRQIKAAPALRKVGDQMSAIKQQINYYRDNEKMDPTTRRNKINELQEKLNKVAEQGYAIASKVGIER